MWFDSIPPRYDQISKLALSDLLRSRVAREVDLYLAANDLSPQNFADELMRSPVTKFDIKDAERRPISRKAISALITGAKRTQINKVCAIADHLMSKRSLPERIFYPDLNVIELAQRQMEFAESKNWSRPYVERYAGLLAVTRRDHAWALDLIIDYLEDFHVLLIRGRNIYRNLDGKINNVFVHGYAIPAENVFLVFLKDGFSGNLYLLKIPRYETDEKDCHFGDLTSFPQLNGEVEYLLPERSKPEKVTSGRLILSGWREGAASDFIEFFPQNCRLVDTATKYSILGKYRDIFGGDGKYKITILSELDLCNYLGDNYKYIFTGHIGSKEP